jgi:hypothetical protein
MLSKRIEVWVMANIKTVERMGEPSKNHSLAVIYYTRRHFYRHYNICVAGFGRKKVAERGVLKPRSVQRYASILKLIWVNRILLRIRRRRVDSEMGRGWNTLNNLPSSTGEDR